MNERNSEFVGDLACWCLVVEHIGVWWQSISSLDFEHVRDGAY